MEAIIISLIGAAATLLAAFIAVFWTKKIRKRKYDLVIKNTWKLGLGFNRCLQIISEANVDPKKITYETSRIQPYVDSLGIQTSFHEEFTRDDFISQHAYKLVEKICSTLDAKYGIEVSSIFQLGRNLFPIAYMVKHYYTDNDYRKNIEEGSFAFPDVLPNLGDPIMNISILPNGLVKGWKSIVKDIESKSDNNAIVTKFEEWVNKITRFFDDYK